MMHTAHSILHTAHRSTIILQVPAQCSSAPRADAGVRCKVLQAGTLIGFPTILGTPVQCYGYDLQVTTSPVTTVGLTWSTPSPQLTSRRTSTGLSSCHLFSVLPPSSPPGCVIPPSCTTAPSWCTTASTARQSATEVKKNIVDLCSPQARITTEVCRWQ